jgi:uncharacterized protein YndB with AHSA1/START domain
MMTGETRTETEITAEPGAPHIVITREFAAPRDLVFRAHTEPELLERWVGPRELTMKVKLNELRDGGRWRFVHTDPSGAEHGFHGVFHGTPSLDGMVRTFEYEGAPGHVSLETAVFEQRGDRTLVRRLACFQSVEARDAMIASGMERGVREGDERLDDLLADL